MIDIVAVRNKYDDNDAGEAFGEGAVPPPQKIFHYSRIGAFWCIPDAF